MSAQVDAPVGGDELSTIAHPWTVVTRHKGGATAGVSVTGDGLLVFVSESEQGSTGTMAKLAPDGTASVQCVRAPQALYFRSDVMSLVPTLPGMAELIEFGDDGGIVLCSPGVLEHLPRGYALVSDRLTAGYDAEVVLEEMMAYAKVGGAAVIRRTDNEHVSIG